MKKLLIYISYFTIFSAFILLSLVSYWLIYPYKVAEFSNLPFPIENPMVKRGERVRYKIQYCKYTNINPQLTKYFIDGVVYKTPKTPSIVPKGCGTIISDAYVPKALPSGTYSLKTVAEYHVNPIRTVEIINYTQPFQVE